MSTNGTNVRRAFCAQRRCPESAFERKFFWRGLYRHAVPFALVLDWLSPSFFHPDRDLITFIGDDQSFEEIREDIERFDYANHVSRHWLRTGLRIRLDSARVAALARQCLQA